MSDTGKFMISTPDREVAVQTLPGCVTKLGFAKLTDPRARALDDTSYPALTARVEHPAIPASGRQVINVSVAATPQHIRELIISGFAFLWEHYPDDHSQLMREMARWRFPASCEPQTAKEDPTS